MFENGIPEISVKEAAKIRNSKTLFLDVREWPEIERVSLGSDVTIVPMSEMAQKGIVAIPQNLLNSKDDIVVFCHHGIRSAQVVAWLIQQGWNNVRSLRGGINAWAHEIDPQLGFY